MVINLLFAGGCFLGSLERIDLGIIGLDFDFHVRSEVADAALPFLFRGGIGAAYLPDCAFDDPVAPFTIFDGDLTGPLRIDAPLFPPESALLPGQNCLTLHCKSSCLFLVMVALITLTILKEKCQQEKSRLFSRFP